MITPILSVLFCYHLRDGRIRQPHRYRSHRLGYQPLLHHRRHVPVGSSRQTTHLALHSAWNGRRSRARCRCIRENDRRHWWQADRRARLPQELVQHDVGNDGRLHRLLRDWFR